MKLLHVRHATSVLTYAGLSILIDPVFAEKEAIPAIALTPNRKRNPLVDLETPIETLLDVDIILSTHTHGDHFDEKAKELLDKKIPLICQSEDEIKLKMTGFLDVIPIHETLTYRNLTITRVNAQHGAGAIGKAMGITSGYILKADGEPTIYFTGDTIFNTSIADNIKKYQPEVMIINAGSPKFLYSDRIVMNIIDLEDTLKVNPVLNFIIVHLEAYNHCIETREDIHEYFSADKLKKLGVSKFCTPKDNELFEEEYFYK